MQTTNTNPMVALDELTTEFFKRIDELKKQLTPTPQVSDTIPFPVEEEETKEKTKRKSKRYNDGSVPRNSFLDRIKDKYGINLDTGTLKKMMSLLGINWYYPYKGSSTWRLTPEDIHKIETMIEISNELKN